MSPRIKQLILGSGVGASALAYALTLELEGGHVLDAYYDSVGVATICAGKTEKVKIGDKETLLSCQIWLEAQTEDNLRVVDKWIITPLPPLTKAVAASFVHNIGEPKFKTSTFVKKANKNDLVGMCNELPRWVYAKKKKLDGLVNRRNVEKELCFLGIGK